MELSSGTFALSDLISIAIIAGLLSLLPVVVMLWIYYVRQKQPSVSGSTVSQFFGIGIVAVVGAVLLEKIIYQVWQYFLPSSADLFFSDRVSPDNLSHVLIAVLVSFGMIALIEEGIKYLLMRRLIWRIGGLDQIIDGVQLGIATGLGFAFLENTFYFLKLFKNFEFDTLVVVFFLRFLISTVGHMSFGGLMGYYLVKAKFQVSEKKVFMRQAFVYPFLMHGFFDFLLAVQLSFYTVLLLIIPVVIFWYWWHDERLFQIYVLHGRALKFPTVSYNAKLPAAKKTIVELLPAMKSCSNCYVPIRDVQNKCLACGAQFHRKKFVKKMPFMPNPNTDT